MALRISKYFYYISAMILFIALDQMVKAYMSIEERFIKNSEIPFLSKFDLSEINTQILYFTVTIALVWLFLVLIEHLKIDENDRFWIVSLILSGMFSNAIDRVLKGYVVDYIKLSSLVINIADIFIAIGMSILIFKSVYQLIFSRRRFHE
ncbi:signal peptidase II [bacterium]|nr:signal peptidase II [bacterium]